MNSNSNPVVAALTALISVSALPPANKQSLISDLVNMKDGVVGAVVAAEPSLEADAETAAEVVADGAITSVVGPFAGAVVPIANNLMRWAAGNLHTALSHLLGAAAEWGHTGATATVTSPIPPTAPAPGVPTQAVGPNSTVAQAVSLAAATPPAPSPS